MDKQIFDPIQTLLTDMGFHTTEDKGQLAEETPPLQYPAALVAFEGETTTPLSHNRQIVKKKLKITLVWQEKETLSGILPEEQKFKLSNKYTDASNVLQFLHGVYANGKIIKRKGESQAVTDKALRMHFANYLV